VRTDHAGSAVSAVALLGALVAAGAASAQEPTLAPGQTVRITAPAKIEVPDVITIDESRTERYGGARVTGEKRGLLTLEVAGRTLSVPTPDARLTGRLVAADDATITLSLGDDSPPAVIPWAAVARVQVRRRKGHPGLGALLGGVGGYLIGYGIYYSSGGDWASNDVLWTLLFIPGAAAGALVWRDSWAPVSTDHLRLAVTPRAGGVSAGVTLAF